MRLFFFSNEGNPLEPVHVHVRNAEKLAKFWVEPAVSLAENFGFSSSELRDLEALIHENIDLIKGDGMPTSVHDAVASRVWCDEDNLWVELADGRRLGVPLAFYPRLLHATPDQRARYELSGGGRGIHWDEIDEDLSVAGLLQGIPDRTATHPHTGHT